MRQETNKTTQAASARLVLYPGDPHYAWSCNEQVLSSLRDIGFAGQALAVDGDEACFLCGDQFLSLIAFLGCAPEIAVAPATDGREFCFLGLPPVADSPLAHFGANAKAALCPQCRAPMHALAEVTEICCSRCGAATPAWQLNWRRSACWARVVINVWGVYESEAVPAPCLLHTLVQTTDVPWQYCYVRS